MTFFFGSVSFLVIQKRNEQELRNYYFGDCKSPRTQIPRGQSNYGQISKIIAEYLLEKSKKNHVLTYSVKNSAFLCIEYKKEEERNYDRMVLIKFVLSVLPEPHGNGICNSCRFPVVLGCQLTKGKERKTIGGHDG